MRARDACPPRREAKFESARPRRERLDRSVGHKASRAGRLVIGHLLRDLELAAVAQVFRDTRRPERVAADPGTDPGFLSAPNETGGVRRRSWHLVPGREQSVAAVAAVCFIAVRSAEMWAAIRVIQEIVLSRGSDLESA